MRSSIRDGASTGVVAPKRLLVLVAIVSASLLSGCAVSVFSSAGDSLSPSEQEYRQVWSRGWAPVISASQPWNPSSSSPGVCNVGGSKQGCWDTDERVVQSMRILVGDLRSVVVPTAFTTANRDLVGALEMEVQGLLDRDLAIAGNSDSVFGRAFRELKSAAAQLVRAYNEFPSGDRPMPAEFGNGQES